MSYKNKSVCAICLRIRSENKRYCGWHKSAAAFHPTSSTRQGYVYLVDLNISEDHTKKLIKIGYSKKPDQRLKTLQAANPFCRFIACVNIRNGAKRFEAYLQRFNEPNYFEREVFSLNVDDISKSITEMSKYGKLR